VQSKKWFAFYGREVRRGQEIAPTLWERHRRRFSRSSTAASGRTEGLASGVMESRV